jgi:membrane protein implicated in regulation of membrane protease activity
MNRIGRLTPVGAVLIGALVAGIVAAAIGSRAVQAVGLIVVVLVALVLVVDFAPRTVKMIQRERESGESRRR